MLKNHFQHDACWIGVFHLSFTDYIKLMCKKIILQRQCLINYIYYVN